MIITTSVLIGFEAPVFYEDPILINSGALSFNDSEIPPETIGWTLLELSEAVDDTTVVVQISDFVLELTFKTDVDSTGASGDALLDPDSYLIAPDDTGVGGQTVASIEVISSTKIRLTLTTRATDGLLYTVTINGAIELQDATELIGRVYKYLSVVTLPHVESITPISAKVLDVEFDRDLRKNQSLANVSKYVITGGPSAISVVRTSTKSVRLGLDSEMVEDAIYQLTILDS